MEGGSWQFRVPNAAHSSPPCVHSLERSDAFDLRQTILRVSKIDITAGVTALPLCR